MMLPACGGVGAPRTRGGESIIDVSGQSLPQCSPHTRG